MNDQLFRKVLGYLESESYLMAYRELHKLADEYMPLETRMDYDALHSSLSIIVGERSGHQEPDEQLFDTSGLYEKLAYLLTKKLLGDNEAAQQTDALILCAAAFGKQRRN